MTYSRPDATRRLPLWALVLTLLLATEALGADRPNIVLLISDDHDYEHLGFMGHPMAETPTLDELARTGFTFTHAHVPMSRCRPSLASLLTGRWPHQHGVYATQGTPPLAPGNTLPALLRDAGYRTYVAGKFWEGDPRAMGFTHGTGTDKETFARRDQADLFAFIDEAAKDEQPVFIWWAPMLPHKPHKPPARYLELFDTDRIEVPPWVPPKHRDNHRKKEHVSLAMEAWLDASAGALVAKLRDTGLLTNTLFAFVIDNGWCNGCVSKGSPFEKGLRTPIVLTLPGTIPAGKRSAQLTSSLDLYPTILDYAGVAPPDAHAGRSLRPAIDGATLPDRDHLFGAIFAGNAKGGSAERDVYALYARGRRWKYILYVQDVVGSRNQTYFRIWKNHGKFPLRDRGDEDLYDLDADPGERHDLAHRLEHAARLREMRTATLQWWHRTGGKPIPVTRPTP